MKRSLLAPLCSAFILPGVGQVINRQMIKGLIVIGVISVWLMVLALYLVFLMAAVMNNLDPAASGGFLGALAAAFRARDLTVLWLMLAFGGLLWVYSVVDAVYYGRIPRPDEEE